MQRRCREKLQERGCEEVWRRGVAERSTAEAHLPTTSTSACAVESTRERHWAASVALSRPSAGIPSPPMRISAYSAPAMSVVPRTSCWHAGSCSRVSGSSRPGTAATASAAGPRSTGRRDAVGGGASELCGLAHTAVAMEAAAESAVCARTMCTAEATLERLR
jgi:hypothetical protein